MAEKLESKRSNLTPEVFLELYRGVMATKRELEKAQAQHRLAMKRAKGAGIETDILRQAIALNQLDTDVVEQRFRDLGRYMSWMGRPIGHQGSLFGASDDPAPSEKAQADHNEWAAREAGYSDGHAGAPRDNNPYPPGSPLAVKWDDGWSAGKADIIEGLTTGKVKKGKRGRRANPEDRPEEQPAA